ncbi:helix-turn-helix transcriptional regulator [Asticcacaulis sp. BYS171W]|uniref:Helix-turn-helix transcriptional regulator n=1 Tax=Asticcacaulis aquaticus TaxID=2984212 RepID=A0ABT5HT48_9CAUL|nr:helix-turn-helix transcriptional regulator [Asticcacaulis aquaticus]MDC7683246.1 helix-turn-helix transcriptional regulator [Asticcacaulis aquaticus]
MLVIDSANSVMHPARRPTASGRIVTERHIQLGQALRRLRQKLDLSVDDVAERVGTSRVTINRYESGDRKALLKEDVQDQVVSALGLTRADLQAEYQAVVEGRSIFDTGRRFPASVPSGAISAGQQGLGVYETDGGEDIDLAALLDGEVRAMRVLNEDVSPYIAPGGFVIYHIKRTPRRHQAVVIKTKTGPLKIRFYVRTTPAQVEVIRMEAFTDDGKPAYREESEFISNSEIQGVYPVVLRGD